MGKKQKKMGKKSRKEIGMVEKIGKLSLLIRPLSRTPCIFFIRIRIGCVWANTNKRSCEMTWTDCMTLPTRAGWVPFLAPLYRCPDFIRPHPRALRRPCLLGIRKKREVAEEKKAPTGRISVSWIRISQQVAKTPEYAEIQNGTLSGSTH